MWTRLVVAVALTAALAGAEGLPSGWEVVGEPPPGCSVTASAGQDGAVLIRLAAGQPASLTVAGPELDLEVGHPYRLKARVRTGAAVSDPVARYPTAVPATLTMESFPFTEHAPPVGASTGWTEVERVFLATSATDRVQLHLGRNGTATGSADFADVTVEPVSDLAQVIALETLRTFDRGFRYDDRGWIFVHVEGEPYERGYQYGSLLSAEIVAYASKLAIQERQEDPAAGWATLRFECDALFLRGFEPEYLAEMKGIADGAAHAGAELFGEPLELLDVVVLNSVVDLGQARDAMEVTPHSLTGQSFLSVEDELLVADSQHKCSAFAATGPATADGEVVFGQIFMWDGYTGVHWNVVCDLVPSQGHRLVYHTFPGGIHSGADFYINDAGIVIGETTVAQTPFDPTGSPQSNRIRKAAQYADSIDDVVRILSEGNNGMYTNDWPIADVTTGEVAIFLLGTEHSKLWRTSEDIAPFGLPGFLWANNNNRDPLVRTEYVAQPDDAPFDLMFSPWNRDIAFWEFYQRHAGELDAPLAARLWASSPINRSHACDGKITTSAMARRLVFLAHHGKTTLREKFPAPGSRRMPDLPGAVPHLTLGYSVFSPLWVTDQVRSAQADGRLAARPPDAEPLPLELDAVADRLRVARRDLWRGTVHPAGPGDAWLVSGSAAYWDLLEGLSEEPDAAAEELTTALAALTARLGATVRREGDLPARAAHRAYDRYGPYLIPRIKGTFALHQLRLLLGTQPFCDLMREIHATYDGAPLDTAAFVRAATARTERDLAPFLAQWLEREGLPELRLEASLRQRRGSWELLVRVHQEGEPYHLVTSLGIDVGGTRRVLPLELAGPTTERRLVFDQPPVRVVLDPLRDLPTAHHDPATFGGMMDDFSRLLVVHGTAQQVEANHTLARRYAETLADAYTEVLPPVVKDAEVTPEQLTGADLIVLGGVADNTLTRRLAPHLPLELGRNWFRWRGRSYAHADDGLMLALTSPYDIDRTMYLVLANSALQLHRMTSSYRRGLGAWTVLRGDEVVAAGHHERDRMTVELAKTR